MTNCLFSQSFIRDSAKEKEEEADRHDNEILFLIFWLLGKHSPKKEEFYENFLQMGGGINWISYLLFRTTYICTTQKYGQSSEKGFRKSSTGEGGHRFMKLFL